MTSKLLMHFLVALSAIVVVAGLAYVYVKPPDSMRVDRDGVPYFTPPVANPMTGEAIPVERLVKHYRGDGVGKALSGRSLMGLDFETTLQIIMFFVAVGMMYLAFLGDPL
ncbi:MAG: hypothetical protein WA108_03195 [Thiobacillus sp.]|jgi:hypothetical protein